MLWMIGRQTAPYSPAPDSEQFPQFIPWVPAGLAQTKSVSAKRRGSSVAARTMCSGACLVRMFQNRTRHGSSECRHTVLRKYIVFQHAFNLGDVEALIALYEPNAVLVVDGQDVIGRESIRKALQNLLPGRGLMTLETRAVVVSQQGLAVLHGSWVIEPPAGMGAELGTRGLSTEVVRKQQDGIWLFVIDNPYTPE